MPRYVARIERQGGIRAAAVPLSKRRPGYESAAQLEPDPSGTNFSATPFMQ